ncbi:MAG: hypothetical protein ABIS69_05185, partial [Sediminibacterium sp.]
GKNVFEIDVPDTIATSLSLAVTDGGIQPDSANNIISQFLLSGEIKGYVHNPAYYFSPYLDSTEEHLDLVMLTNGWRRFKWEDVWAGRTPLLPYTADTNYLSVSGKIDSLNERKIKKAETVNMILVSKDDSRKFIFTQLHDDGSFEEKNLILFDSTKIFYQLNRVLLPGHSHIKISNSFLPLDTIKRIRTLYTGISDTVSLSRVQFIHREQKRLDSLKNKTTLQEVIVNTKFKTRLEQLDDKYASGQFSGHGTTIYEYNLMDDPLGNKRTTILDYLRDSVPTFSAAPYPRLAGIPTAFILNGETGISLNELNTMSVAQIAYVKAFPAFSYGGKPTPFIVIYTKKGKDLSVNSGGLSEMGSSWIAGYTPVREFYLPKNDEQPMNATVPDLRRTIYWKPNIETGGKNTKVKIIFYNNDISQSLRIALEGMTKDGRLIHVNKILK